MSEKQLWHVTMATDLLVLAETAEEAEGIAERHRAEQRFEAEPARPMDHFPVDWDEDCLPYGDTNMTIGDHITAGHAPRYSATVESLRRRKR